jgi:hypothetical protein
MEPNFPDISRNRGHKANPYPANDPDAMRLRYGHGLTGYRAQDDEWNHVVLHPWFPDNEYRYAYTAITPARENVVSWEQSDWWQK